MINGKKRFCVLSSIFIACTSCFASAMENDEIKEDDKVREENEQRSQYHSRELKNRDLEFGGKKRNRSPQGVKVSNRNKKRGSYDRVKSGHKNVTFKQVMEKLDIYTEYNRDKRTLKNINERFSFNKGSKKIYFNDPMDLLSCIGCKFRKLKNKNYKDSIRIFYEALHNNSFSGTAHERENLRVLGITFEFEHELACKILSTMIVKKINKEKDHSKENFWQTLEYSLKSEPRETSTVERKSFALELIKTIDGIDTDQDAEEFLINMIDSKDKFIKNKDTYLRELNCNLHEFIDNYILSSNNDN